ncbi:MAG: hypothetical protein AAB786_01710 [Patescibacteria group bacterium]
MDKLPKFTREVVRRPRSAPKTNEISGYDFEDNIKEAGDAQDYYINIKAILLEQYLDIEKNIKVLEIWKW